MDLPVSTTATGSSNPYGPGGAQDQGQQIQDRIKAILERIATRIQNPNGNPWGFGDLVKIFQANVPILKFSGSISPNASLGGPLGAGLNGAATPDGASGGGNHELEIDFCINNRLGMRNSRLLQRYCQVDPRVKHLGRLIKTWAKKKDLVGKFEFD